MRLRKTMKRTAAAVLALSMAVSAAAMPASAGFNIDMSKVDGDVEITQADDNGSAKVTIMVGGADKTKDFSDGKEGNDVTITGDNTKPAATESLNAAEENADENTSEVEKPTEAEKSGETKTEGEGKTQNSAAENKEQTEEPGSLELLAPEDEQKKDEEKKDEQKPAETQETEQDKKTEKTSDQVIEYGQNDPEAQKEATKLEAKPVVKQETGEKKAAEEKTYGDTNAPTSITEKAQATARNVVSIFNSSAKALKVILRDLKVDAGDTNKSAVTVSGKGGVTLELDGKNELTGGSGDRGNQNRRADGIHVSEGWDQYGSSFPGGKLTIQGKEGSSLSVTGGSGTENGGDGISAYELELVDATVTATGGAGGGSGVETKKDSNIKNSKLIANGGIWNNGKFTVGEGGEVIAIGKDAKTTDGKAQGGNALAFWGRGSGYEVQKGGKLTAIGGNAKSGSGKATGGDAIRGNNYDFEQVTVKEGTFTALGGKAESTTSAAANGNSVKITQLDGDRKTQLKVEEGGTFVTAKPGESEDNGNGITGKIEINTAGGKIEEVKNAEVVKKDDGTVEVVGDLVGVETGNLKYELTATVQPTCTTPGKRVYTCTTKGHEGETYEETIDALGHEFVNGVCTRCGAPESSSGSSAVTLTVTGAGAYETSIADGRYVVAVPAEAAVLSGCLSNLKELKAQGVNTLVFRTQLRETALNIDSMLSLGVDGTLFTLTHSGESASLTIGGFEHNELIH